MVVGATARFIVQEETLWSRDDRVMQMFLRAGKKTVARFGKASWKEEMFGEDQ